jgi:hypothetical protein
MDILLPVIYFLLKHTCQINRNNTPPFHHLPEELVRHRDGELTQNGLKVVHTNKAVQVPVKGQKDLLQVQVVIPHLLEVRKILIEMNYTLEFLYLNIDTEPSTCEYVHIRVEPLAQKSNALLINLKA